MKKYTLPFISLLVAVLFISCASKKVKDDTLTVEQVSAIEECYYPDSLEDKAPLWVCGAPIGDLAMHAVGIAEKSKAGFSFMRQLAATDARTLLAQEMRVQVRNMVKTFAETTGRGDTETLDEVNTVVTKQITDETLTGARIIRYQSSPAGSLYVLVGMDAEAVRGSVKRAVSTSYHDDNAAWQQFRAEQGQEELSNSIANQPLDQAQ